MREFKDLYKIKLKKDDIVAVRAGSHKGKTGKVLAVHPKTNMVTVEGINIVKKHVKPTKANPTGGITEITKPIDVSKVGILDSKTNKPSRIKYVVEAGVKKRVLVSSGKEIK
jgi:large subunit ribosomal protein L24